MRKISHFLLILFIPILTLILTLVFPSKAYAMTVGEIFTSPESILVRVQERIEYALTFNIDRKILVLEKHAKRRLDYAGKRAKEGDDTQTAVLVKSYEGTKKKENLLLKDAPVSVMELFKERVTEEQKTIEEIKDDVGDEVKNSIENTQKTIISDAIETVKTKEGEGKATEFAAKIADFVNPNVIPHVIKEDGGGGSEMAPGGGDKPNVIAE